VFGTDLTDHLDLLLEPSVIYSPVVSSAVATGGVHAAAHITGGGLAGNLPRALPDGMGATVDLASWEPPPVFELVSSRGIERSEMLSTFNMGIGFCLIVDPQLTGEVMAATAAHSPTVIGSVGPGSGVSLT
jgi:phosphoribosylformylglycinamidine cyclo-ligase